MLVYVFNLSEQVVAVLDSEINEVLTLIHHRRINVGDTGDDNYLEIEIPANLSQSQYVVEGNYLGFTDVDDNFQMFRVVRYDDEDNEGIIIRKIYAPHIVYELRDSIVEDKKPRDVSASTCISSILSTEAIATRWSTGTVDSFGANNINFYYQSSWSALLKMRERWSYVDDDGVLKYGIINPRLTFTGSSISARYIDFKKDIGTFRGKVFTVDRGLKSITRDVDISNIATAVYAFGKGEEIETTPESADNPTGSVVYGKRITIEDEVWQKADSDLTNPDFEDGLTGWSTSAGSVSVDTSFCNVGTQCIKFGNGTTINNGAILSSRVDVTAGNTYNGRCLVYTEDTSTSFEISLNYRDASNVSTGVFTQRIVPNVNTWTLLKVEGLAPATTVEAFISINGTNATGLECWVDKARIGDYATKPATQGWIEDSTAKTHWGYAGGTRNIFKKYVNADTTDTSILIQQAWWYLQSIKTPKISYTLSVMDLEDVYNGRDSEKIRLGDTVYIQDFNFTPTLNISTQILELHRNYLEKENTEIKLGNFFEESLDAMSTAEDVKEDQGTNSGIWNKGTLYEDTPTGNTRMRLVEVESGEYASELRYEDDEGNLIGYFNSSEFQYDEIYGGNVYAQNVLNVDKTARIYYVNSTSGDDLNDGLTSGTAWKTLNRAKNAIPKVLLNNVSIFLGGSAVFYEDITFDGFIGSGFLQIEALLGGITFEGRIQFRSCQCPIFLKGFANTNASTYFKIHSVISGKAPVEIYNCQKVRMLNIWCNCNSIGVHGVRIDASNLYIDNCVTSNASSFGGITALDMSNIYVVNCRGSSNLYGVWSIRSSHIGLDTTYPLGTSANKQTDGKTGTITDTATATATAQPTPPSNPIQKYQTICTASNSNSYNIKRFEWQSDTIIRQGQINSDTGNYYGFMFFNGTNKFSALSGKTIYSAKVTVKRKSGGLADARTLRIYGHNYLGTYGESSGTDAPQTNPTIGTSYGEIATIKWQEELQFYMPSTFLTEVGSGSCKGILLYQPTASDYVQLIGADDFDITIEFMHN